MKRVMYWPQVLHPPPPPSLVMQPQQIETKRTRDGDASLREYCIADLQSIICNFTDEYMTSGICPLHLPYDVRILRVTHGRSDGHSVSVRPSVSFGSIW